MQAVRIASYKITNGTFSEIAEEAKTGVLSKLQEQSGFIRYGVAKTGDATCLSISLWDSNAQAEAASLVVATWVRENLADRVELRSTEVGELAFFEGVPTTV